MGQPSRLRLHEVAQQRPRGGDGGGAICQPQPLQALDPVVAEESLGRLLGLELRRGPFGESRRRRTAGELPRTEGIRPPVGAVRHQQFTGTQPRQFVQSPAMRVAVAQLADAELAGAEIEGGQPLRSPSPPAWGRRARAAQ